MKNQNSNNNSKKEIDDEVPIHVSLATVQALDDDNGTKDTPESTISNICNGNLSEMPIAKTAVLELTCSSNVDINDVSNLDENIDTNIQFVENEQQPNTCSASTQESIIPNVEYANLDETKPTEEVSNDDNVITIDETDITNVQFEENASQCDVCCLMDEEIIIVKDSIHELNLTGNSDLCSENVDNDSNILTFNLHSDTVNKNTIYFTSEPSITNNTECSKIINIVESIHYENSDNQVEENFRDQNISVGDTTQNLGATITLQANSDIVSSVNSNVESYNIIDDINANSDFNTDKHRAVECEIPISINQIEAINTDNSVRVAENSDTELSVNHNKTSDTKITKEELNSSAITSINESRDIKTMADLNDKCINLEEEISDLKLQLNASQQVRASLELQLTQKEEVIIKSQTESLRKQQSYKQEIKQLKDKLDEKNAEDDNTPLKELQETNKSLKLREAKLLSELNARKNDEQNYRKIMDEFEKTIATQVSELQKLNEEHTVVKRHLATLELAFSDVLQKYDRSKKIIEGFKCNEEALRQSLAASEDNIMKSEQKYESLKAHAKAQIEKCNQEILLMREQYDSEIHKLTAIVKRLEIKNASLTDSLDQKNKECSALAALCDEVTGKV